jgi:hypothetical protein
MGTDGQRHEERVRATVGALLAAAQREPERARALLPALSDDGSAVRRELCALVDAGRAIADAVRPMDAGTADWVVDQALDVVAARLADGDADPALSDLVGPLTALALLPYAGLPAVTRALAPRAAVAAQPAATSSASASPTTGASARTVSIGASPGRSAARPRRTRSAHSSQAPAATASETSPIVAGAARS